MYSHVLPALLFFIISPGILTRIPKNGDKYLVALVHSIIFAILLHFLMKYLPFQEGYGSGGMPEPLFTYLIVIGCFLAAASLIGIKVTYS